MSGNLQYIWNLFINQKCHFSKIAVLLPCIRGACERSEPWGKIMRYSPVVISIIILGHIKYSFQRRDYFKLCSCSSEVDVWRLELLHTKVTLCFYQTWHFLYWPYALLYMFSIHNSWMTSISSCFSESAHRCGGFSHCITWNTASQVSAGRGAPRVPSCMTWTRQAEQFLVQSPDCQTSPWGHGKSEVK